MKRITLSGAIRSRSKLFLRLLSLLWQAGSALDRRAKRNRVARLPVPVVSVGNITTGGTGKTPVVIELLREFRGAGAGLLTRGHGRTTRENVLLLNQKDRPPVSRTGDEAQLSMQAADVPIGVGADRWATGMQLLEAADVRILFLDDGFQHLQLHRDFDLVLIDALRPFGGGELLPLGRLREPLKGLARADAFLITRANEAPNTKAIEAMLRRYNSGAPIFCAETIPCKWRAADGSEFDPDPFAGVIKDLRAIAFCGLGNPQAFWRTLKGIGIKPLACYAVRRPPPIHAIRNPAPCPSRQRYGSRGVTHDRERRCQSRSGIPDDYRCAEALLARGQDRNRPPRGVARYDP